MGIFTILAIDLLNRTILTSVGNVVKTLAVISVILIMYTFNKIITRKYSPMMVHEFTIELDEDMDGENLANDIAAAIDKVEQMESLDDEEDNN